MTIVHYKLANSAVPTSGQVLDDNGNVFNIRQKAVGGAFTVDDSANPILVANLDKNPHVYRAGGGHSGGAD